MGFFVVILAGETTLSGRIDLQPLDRDLGSAFHATTIGTGLHTLERAIDGTDLLEVAPDGRLIGIDQRAGHGLITGVAYFARELAKRFGLVARGDVPNFRLQLGASFSEHGFERFDVAAFECNHVHLLKVVRYIAGRDARRAEVVHPSVSTCRIEQGGRTREIISNGVTRAVSEASECESADSYLNCDSRAAPCGKVAAGNVPNPSHKRRAAHVCYFFSMIALARINSCAEGAFVQLLGGVFENSPWVAQRAFARRPFASRAALHTAMVDVVKSAGSDEQVALLNAHPELAGEALDAGTLSASSTLEQSSAELHALTPAERARITRLNQEYRARFGFPFIIAVRDHDRASIVAALERRLRATRETELGVSLDQVYRITAIRLERIVRSTRA